MTDSTRTLGSRLTMGQVCKVLRVSRALARQWEQQGKLVPVERTQKGVRLYDVDQVVELRERRVEAQLRSVTRTVAPEAAESVVRREALAAALEIVKHAATLKPELVKYSFDNEYEPEKAAEFVASGARTIEAAAQAWTAAAKMLAVIVEATTPITTVTKTLSATTTTTAPTPDPWFEPPPREGTPQ